MRLKLKKMLALICCIALMIPIGTMAVSSDEPEEAAVETAVEEEDNDKSDAVPKTEEEAFALMELVTENDKLALYLNKEEAAIALKDKISGEIWWSNPINADLSDGKKAQIQELKAGMTLIYGEVSKRRTTTVNSKMKGKVKYTNITNGVKGTYSFATAGITIPVSYILEDDYLKVYVDTSEIEEKEADKITTDLSFMTTFGAATTDENGYFVIPDGSGALINFNNNKTSYKVYSGKVYNRDITAIKITKPATTQTVSLPMYGIVKENAGLMVVADKGDTCATINAYVAGQNKTSYNTCYFDFEIRTSDEYLMGGDANPLKVFEKRGILVPEIEIRYYPVSSADNSEVDYVDIAEKYRDYLTTDKNVTKSDTVNNTAMYIDLYGGVMKTETVLGIPVNMAHEATTYKEAQGILEELKALGTTDIVVNYNQWTTDDIKQKVSDSASPSSLLGGKSNFNKLMNYAKSNDITIYPSVDNLTFKTGGGYFTVTDTAIRVSNAYSRQIIYDLAYGVENKFYKSMSLLSPTKYGKIFDNLAQSYSKNNISTISLGSWANTIYGDYGRKAVSREMAKGYLEEGYSMLGSKIGSVLADNANAYVLPFVDHITSVPLSSSKFDIFDAEIPFYQLVIHGLKPYSTTSINGDADVADLVLRGIASGSNMHFDFVADDASELKDTLYDTLYYSNYKYWIEDAAGCSKFADDILSDISSQYITEYNILSEDEIETVYANGTKTIVNLDDRTVTKNDKVYKLSDYVGEGVIG